MPEIFFRNNLVYVQLINTVNSFAVLDKASYDKIIIHKIAGRQQFNILYNLRKHNPRNFPYWQQKINTAAVKKNEVFTIYLHKLVAEIFSIPHSEKLRLGNKNSINIDCRLFNLEYGKAARKKSVTIPPIKDPLLLFLAHVPVKPKLQVFLRPEKTDIINEDTGKVIWTTNSYNSPQEQNNQVTNLLVSLNLQLEPVCFNVLNDTIHDSGTSVFDVLPFRTIIKHEAPTV